LGGCKMKKLNEGFSSGRHGVFSKHYDKNFVTPAFVHENVINKVNTLLGNVKNTLNIRPDNNENKMAIASLSKLFTQINSVIVPINKIGNDEHPHAEQTPTMK
jgi:hypothetical protein